MRWLALGCILLLCLAGCSGKGKEPAPSASASVSHSASHSNSTAPVNHAPTANLTATPPNGTAPLNVTFAVGGGDLDGNSTLNWTLSFGDGNRTNGTGLPASAKHGYAAGGNFTARLIVSDGRLNATANMTVRVLPGLVGFAPGMDPNCQRPDAIEIPGSGLYNDDRGSPAGGFVTGGGSWLYQETNDLPGLQISQVPGSVQHEAGDDSDVDTLAVQYHCEGGDTLIL